MHYLREGDFIQMSKGCFKVEINPEDSWDIKCELLEDINGQDIPEEQLLILQNIEVTSNYISTLKNTKYEIKKKYFEELLSLAKIGLSGDNPRPSLSLEMINTLKEKICHNEGSRIKNKYMINLGIYVICGIFALIIARTILSYNNFINIEAYINVSIGSLIGAWISFGARKLNLTFEELSLVEEDGLKPWMRLIYVCICSNVVLLFVNTNLIDIYIGTFKLSDVNNSVDLQILLGVICGLVEYKVGTGLFNKANSVLKI